MKTLRFIGMALLATVLSINLTACSDDDGDGSSDGSGDVKKLTSIIAWEGEDDTHVTRLSYDKKKRLTEVEHLSLGGGNPEVTVNTIDYEDNSIIMTETYNGNVEGRTVCSLNSDGYITRTVWEPYSSNHSYTELYTYDANNQLIKVVCTDDIETVLTWSDGNIVKVVVDDNYTYYPDSYTSTSTYTYNSTLSSKVGIVFYDDYFIDVFSNPYLCWLADVGYFGKLPTNLISKTYYVDNDDYEESCQITYEYDNDGYVSNISACWGDVSLSWE